MTCVTFSLVQLSGKTNEKKYDISLHKVAIIDKTHVTSASTVLNERPDRQTDRQTNSRSHRLAT